MNEDSSRLTPSGDKPEMNSVVSIDVEDRQPSLKRITTMQEKQIDSQSLLLEDPSNKSI